MRNRLLLLFFLLLFVHAFSYVAGNKELTAFISWTTNSLYPIENITEVKDLPKNSFGFLSDDSICELNPEDAELNKIYEQALSFFNKADYGKAIETINSLLEYKPMYENNNVLQKYKVAIYKLLANCYMESSDLNKANEAYNKAMEYAKEIDETSILIRSLYNEIGYYYLILNDIDVAEMFLAAAKQLYENNTDIGTNYAVCLFSLSTVMCLRGRTLQAKLYSDTAFDIFRNSKEENSRRWALSSIINTAGAYAGMRYFEDASNVLDRAHELSETWEMEDFLLYIETGEGVLCSMKDDMAEAQKHFKTALHMAEKQKNDSAIFHIIERLLLRAQYFSGDFDADFEEQLRKLSQDVYSDIISKFSFLSEDQRNIYWMYGIELSDYNTLLATRPSKKNNITILQNALFSKELLLRTSNWTKDKMRSSITAEDLEKLKEREAISKLLGEGSLSLDSTVYYQIRMRLIDTELMRSNVSYLELYNYLMPNWEKISKRLGTNDAAIEFIKLNEYSDILTIEQTRYAALIVTHGCKYPVLVNLCREDDLNLKIKNNGQNDLDFFNNLYAPKLERGKLLYELVWEPIEPYLKKAHTIYYAPIGKLSSVAFDALKYNDQFLHDRYNLHLVSSIAEVINLETRKQDVPQSAVVYGGIAYNAKGDELLAEANEYNRTRSTSVALANDGQTRLGWGELEESMNEADGICKILDDNNVSTSLLSGVRANEESFKALNQYSPWLIHIATHGFFLPDAKEVALNVFIQKMQVQNKQFAENLLNRSGLLFAGANRAWLGEDLIEGIDDGILTAEEISHLNLSHTKLAVLSACESGLGESKSSEGVFGLQRAFKLAGVETLVMSLWKVSDKVTTDFMLRFYTEWLGGKDMHNAFRSAQDYIKSRYPQPYYWAAFVMMD